MIVLNSVDEGHLHTRSSTGAALHGFDPWALMAGHGLPVTSGGPAIKALITGDHIVSVYSFTKSCTCYGVLRATHM
jgi:hypothetical protein